MNGTPDGSPEGLADSVRPVLEMEAPVENNGIGFIANVIPAALWLGAGIAVFFVNLQVLPRHAKPFHPAAQWLGKLLMPGALVMAQSLLLLFTIMVVLKVQAVHPWALTLTILSAGLAFLCLTWLVPWLQVTCVGVGAAVLPMLMGRWRFVSLRQLRPRLDL